MLDAAREKAPGDTCIPTSWPQTGGGVFRSTVERDGPRQAWAKSMGQLESSRHQDQDG